MDTLEAIRSRRSIKHFDSTFRMTQEEIDELIDLAMQSPSSFNLQHWRLVNVTDPDLRQQIQEAAHGQVQVTEASLLFIITGDLNAWAKDPARYWRHAPQAAQDILVPMIEPFYKDNAQLQRDEVLRSVGFISQTLMLAAKAMGYDSCPMIGFDQQKVAKLIKLPEDHVIGMMLSIGKALKPAWPKPGFIDRSEAVIENTF